MKTSSQLYFGVVFSLAVLVMWPAVATAHCDTMDGPVVMDAKAALEKGDVTPVLKWVGKDAEPEIRAAFSKAMVVRSKGAEARDLADRFFFETLVRVHRAGEGARFTGLKPGGTDPGAAVTAADKALESGSSDALVKLVTDRVSTEVRERYARAAEAKKHANDSVEAGREFVRAYVEFIHHAERLYSDAAGQAGHDDIDAASSGNVSNHAHK
jgi:uncharacterized protein DUF6448